MTRLQRRLRRRTRYVLESLDPRTLLTGGALTITLDPSLDQFGDQVQTIQAYGDPSEAALGLFDTGSSVVSFASSDQATFQDQGAGIPIKVAGGAAADGIGGSITGDVSEPGTILADGIHAATLSFDNFGFPVYSFAFGPASASVPGIQAFVGTDAGSPDLPTVTGTPILSPTAAHPKGLAARIDWQGATLDFGDLFPGLTVTVPDLNFVSPGSRLRATTDTTQVVNIPLIRYGDSNFRNPGRDITASQNETIPKVSAVSVAGASARNEHFLLDTGSQLSVISTAVAAKLHLDLNNPDTSIDVQGVGGIETVPGFTLDRVVLPRTDGGTVVLKDIPVYVLDVAPGIDGILGTNAFDTAKSTIFDPTGHGGGLLSVTYLLNPDRTGGGLGGGGGFAINAVRDHEGLDLLLADGLASIPAPVAAGTALDAPGLVPPATLEVLPNTGQAPVPDIASVTATTPAHPRARAVHPFDRALADLARA